jgi:predicted TIM-barrel fold metal-dependent hydrolase
MAIEFEIPSGACDCHVHVFEPKQFPYAARRVYTPPEASMEDLLEVQRALKFERVVIVQPSIYGIDNSCTVDSIRRLGRRARGVAVIGNTTSREELQKLHAAGVRGVRLNFEVLAEQIDPESAKKLLDTAAEQIAGLGLHIQILTRPSFIAALSDRISQLPFAVVLDHFGGFDPVQFASQPGFAAVVELLKLGRIYVKISGAYLRSKARDYSDIAPLAQALVKANSERIVWGSNWPHPNNDFGLGKPLTEVALPLEIDEGLLLNQLPKWVPDPAVRKKILVDNPARLYGFEIQ